MSDIVIKIAEIGLSQPVYDLFGTLGIIAALVFPVWYGKKLNLKCWHTALFVSVSLTVSFFSIHVIIIDAVCFITEHSSIPGVLTTSIIRVLLLIPMVSFWMCKVLKLEWGRVCDTIAFVPMLLGGIGAFGCIFTGCCRGFPCEFGIYNSYVEEVVFPIQLVNAFLMLVIAVYIYLRSKHRNFVSDGLSYPIMLILFGSTRFLTEFLCDNQKVLLGCSVLAIHALKDCIVGMIAFYWIRHCKKALRVDYGCEL